MVDMSAIAGAISALKGATDVTQAMIGFLRRPNRQQRAKSGRHSA